MLNERENYSLEEMDRQSLFHPLTSIAAHMKSGPLIVEHGSGVRIKDHRGRDMIDCLLAAFRRSSSRPASSSCSKV